VAAAVLIASHSPSALGRLPVWTFLLAIGSISLVGGTVASLVGEPITDLPGENELVGDDLIVVSRARWSELTELEELSERRSPPPEEPRPRPAVRPAPRPRVTRRSAPPAEAPVPTIDDLLADLPVISDEEAAKVELWRETDDSREEPTPARSPPPSPTPPRAAPSGTARSARLPPPAKAEVAAARSPDPELERLLSELESEATKAMVEREDESGLIQPGLLTCAGCQRTVGIAESWGNCEECLATYCARCRDQLQTVGGRSLCPTCRAAARTSRR
jgi:hypothetical protein